MSGIGLMVPKMWTPASKDERPRALARALFDYEPEHNVRYPVWTDAAPQCAVSLAHWGPLGPIPYASSCGRDECARAQFAAAIACQLGPVAETARAWNCPECAPRFIAARRALAANVPDILTITTVHTGEIEYRLSEAPRSRAALMSVTALLNQATCTHRIEEKNAD